MTPPSSSSPRRCRFIAGLRIAIVCGLLVAPAAARAGNAEQARELVARATRAHKEGRYEEARVDLEAAYALTPRPNLLYALGQIHAKLGRCRDAEAYFRRYATTQRDPRVDRVVDQAIAVCQRAAVPPTDGPPPASSPGTAAPPPPSVAPPTGEPATPPIGEPPTNHPAQPFAATRIEPARVSPPAPRPWYQDALGDGLVLGGVVAGEVGWLEYRSAQSDLEAAEDRARTTTLAGYHDLVDGAHGKRTASILLFGAGGALIAGGVVRYAMHAGDAEVGVGVGVAPVRGGGMVTYAGSL